MNDNDHRLVMTARISFPEHSAEQLSYAKNVIEHQQMRSWFAEVGMNAAMDKGILTAAFEVRGDASFTLEQVSEYQGFFDVSIRALVIMLEARLESTETKVE